jgi:tRNA U34 5-methylaminomethyl-2-thiouridine-forming methyltransferase MnmC
MLFREEKVLTFSTLWAATKSHHNKKKLAELAAVSARRTLESRVQVTVQLVEVAVMDHQVEQLRDRWVELAAEAAAAHQLQSSNN